MQHLQKIKKILTLPVILVLSVSAMMAIVITINIVSEFTNWEVLDDSNGYGYGYGYGCLMHLGNCTNYYVYGYGYGYDANSIMIDEDTSDGGGSSSGPKSINNHIDEDTVEKSLEDFLDGDAENQGNIKDSPFGDPINEAYQYAYSLGITTMGDVQSAMPEQGTTRAQLAKMMVQFASNALGKSIDASRIEMCSSYDDVDVSFGDLKDFIIAACSMKIMWLEVDENNPLPNFDPNSFVSRWEIATVLGRLIFGNAYKNIDPYYAGYMTALFNAGVMTINDPTIMDIRANIWIMLQRAHMWLAGK